MKEWLQYCKKTGLTVDELLLVSQKIFFNHRKSIFKHIYDRERGEHPEKSDGQIRREIAERFNISEKTLEKFIY